MSDLKVLIVVDGDRFNFGPRQNPTGPANADYFGISELIQALRNSSSPTVQVDTAHRRGYTFGPTSGTANDIDTSVNLTYVGDFTFAPTGAPHTVTADLSQYDVLWLIGDEGINDGGPVRSNFTKLLDSEKIAIANFMESGGGVFAVGDHDGIGSYMCGQLPRIRTMRRWFYYDPAKEPQTPPAGGNSQKFTPNWNASGLKASLPLQPDRNDTLRPDSTDHANYYFDDQGDPTPQPLLTASGAPLLSGPVHTILRDAMGVVIDNFPDHMHEGEATDFTSVASPAFNPNSAPNVPYKITYAGAPKQYDEFPIVGGYQPVPEVIAYGKDLGHSTILGGTTYPTTNPKTRGAVAVYDGHAVGVGRIVTGSTFHHYLDKNLVGDPGTASTTSGVGPTNSDQGLPASVLAGIFDFYVNVVTWLARPNRNVHIWTLKNTFGADEAATAAASGHHFTNAFFVVIENYTPNQVGVSPTITLSGAFAAQGVSFKQEPRILPDGGGLDTPQRILIPFTILSIPNSAFPTSGAPKVEPLEVRLTIGTSPLAAEALFELVAGADPYFSNVDPANPNAFYLSRDLRVFEAGPNAASTPFVGWPASGSGYDYMVSLLNYLNKPANGFTSGANDPFTTLSEANDLAEASSVTPDRHSFAIARVRLNGTPGAFATNVKVLFRLWTASSNDTDYDPTSTYVSTLDGAGLPDRPLPAPGGLNSPLFASGQTGAGDYDIGANERTITIGSGETWAYFGCYFDVYGNPNVSLIGAHHCLVAQIAYDAAPILGATGITLSPENSDKLAQRNIIISGSGNPGGPDAHRITHPFDLRPSTRKLMPAGTLAGHPDELWIDWGNIPIGTVAHIYWPNVRAIDVIRLANFLYSTHRLSIEDANTLTCTVTGPVTYIPIPFSAGANFAGLITLDLPLGVRRGQKFKVVVRRVSSRYAPEIRIAKVTRAARRGASVQLTTDWRYIVGTFEVSIPVDIEERLLLPEENTLAILKWRLEQMAPSDRWYPVMLRYIQQISARVDGFGGNPGVILPSPTGVPAPNGDSDRHHHLTHFTGKVRELIYDCFGDFDSFVVENCSECRTYHARESAICDIVLHAMEDRLTITVFSGKHPPHRIQQIAISY